MTTKLDELVTRFLTWPVPADVYPDGTPGKPGRTGTNLLTASQAKQMLTHVLASEEANGEQHEGDHFASLPENLRRCVWLLVGERQRQDEKWGGPEHDDLHTTADFVQLVHDYAGWARVMSGMGSIDKAQKRMVQVAALALADVERAMRYCEAARAHNLSAPHPST